MDLNELLKMGAELIQNNDDDSTTGLDLDSISSALSNVLGDGEGIDFNSIISSFSEGGLSDIVSSWLGDGENASIDADTISNLLGEDKINQFAEQLGISTESASKALADVLPSIVDKASSEDSNLVGDLLDKVGGISGAMDMLGKFFK